MIRRNFCMFPSCFFHVFLPQILKRYKEEGFISPPPFFFNKNLLTACVPRKPLPQLPTSLMAPELGETQGTAPRAKYSDHGKERGQGQGLGKSEEAHPTGWWGHTWMSGSERAPGY